MDQKTISWVSYLTLIGWIIALVSYNGALDKSSLAKFHLRQSLGIMITGFLIYIVAFMAIFSLGFFAMLVWILDIGIFIYGSLVLFLPHRGRKSQFLFWEIYIKKRLRLSIEIFSRSLLNFW